MAQDPGIGESHFAGVHNQDFRYISKCLGAVGSPSLDLGCGDDLYSHTLASRGARVVGLDLDPISLRLAKKEDRGRLYLVRGDATHLAFRSNSFQCVLSTEVLTHLTAESRMKALREVSRVADDGADILLTFHNGDETHILTTPTPSQERAFSLLGVTLAL